MTIVFDNGSSISKAGFSGETSPRTVFPSLVGRHKRRGCWGPTYKEGYVGYEAIANKGILTLRHPIQYRGDGGALVRWADMELLWHDTFYDMLKVDTTEHGVLLSENMVNSKENREEVSRIMFESFAIPSIYFANQSVLALYASGKKSGIVLDCGDGITVAVPIYEGHALPHAVSSLDLAGRDLTENLMRMLLERGKDSVEKYCIPWKEEHCYVAIDFQDELQKASSKSHLSSIEIPFELPDGSVINVGTERFMCTEILFQPEIIGIETAGIHEMVLNSIRKCDIDYRKELYNNVVLSGGCTMLRGFSERMTRELTELAPNNIRLESPPERNYSSWIGGSMLSSLSTFKTMWITAE